MPGGEQVRAAVIGLVVAYVLHHLCPPWCLARGPPSDSRVEDHCASLN